MPHIKAIAAQKERRCCIQAMQAGHEAGRALSFDSASGVMADQALQSLDVSNQLLSLCFSGFVMQPRARHPTFAATEKLPDGRPSTAPPRKTANPKSLAFVRRKATRSDQGSLS